MIENEVTLLSREGHEITIVAHIKGSGTATYVEFYELYDALDANCRFRLSAELLGMLDITLAHCTPTMHAEATLEPDSVLVYIAGIELQVQANWPGAAAAPGVFLCSENDEHLHFYLEDLRGALIVAAAFARRTSKERP